MIIKKVQTTSLDVALSIYNFLKGVAPSICIYNDVYLKPTPVYHTDCWCLSNCINDYITQYKIFVKKIFSIDERSDSVFLECFYFSVWNQDYWMFKEKVKVCCVWPKYGCRIVCETARVFPNKSVFIINKLTFWQINLRSMQKYIDILFYLLRKNKMIMSLTNPVGVLRITKPVLELCPGFVKVHCTT